MFKASLFYTVYSRQTRDKWRDLPCAPSRPLSQVVKGPGLARQDKSVPNAATQNCLPAAGIKVHGHCQVVVTRTFNPSSQEAETGGSQGQPGLQSDCQGCYIEKPCVEPVPHPKKKKKWTITPG